MNDDLIEQYRRGDLTPEQLVSQIAARRQPVVKSEAVRRAEEALRRLEQYRRR